MRSLLLFLAVVAVACGVNAAAGTKEGQCLYADGSTQGACDYALQCVWMGSCDPGFGQQLPCGHTCVDCANPSGTRERDACASANDGGP